MSTMVLEMKNQPFSSAANRLLNTVLMISIVVPAYRQLILTHIYIILRLILA